LEDNIIGSGCGKDVEDKVVVKEKQYWTPEKYIMTNCQMKSLFGTGTVCWMCVNLVKRKQLPKAAIADEK